MKYIDMPLIGLEERKRFVRMYLSSSGNVFYESLCIFVFFFCIYIYDVKKLKF